MKTFMWFHLEGFFLVKKMGLKSKFNISFRPTVSSVHLTGELLKSTDKDKLHL